MFQYYNTLLQARTMKTTGGKSTNTSSRAERVSRSSKCFCQDCSHRLPCVASSTLTSILHTYSSRRSHLSRSVAPLGQLLRVCSIRAPAVCARSTWHDELQLTPLILTRLPHTLMHSKQSVALTLNSAKVATLRGSVKERLVSFARVSREGRVEKFNSPNPAAP